MRILPARFPSLGAGQQLHLTLLLWPWSSLVIGACREKPSPIIRRKVSIWRSMEFVFTMWSGAMADPCAASRQRKHDHEDFQSAGLIGLRGPQL